MCKYCELKESNFKGGIRKGKYIISNEVIIKNSKLVIQTNVNRRTALDDYYESWGLDCDGEFARKEAIFDIKFCPFCGKKLNAEYKPKIFVYINDDEKANKFCDQYDWLLREFDYKRLRQKDISGNSYYLSLKVFDIINDSIKKNKSGLSLKSTLYLSKYLDKPEQYEFNEVKSFLSEGYDTFVEIKIDCPFKERTIEKLKKMKYEVILISVDNLTENSKKSSLNIVINSEYIIHGKSVEL